MKRKYAVISGFMSKLQDRFFQYQPEREMREIVKMCAEVKGCEGIEVVYPQNFTDAAQLRALLKEYALQPAIVNLNIKSEEKFRFGSFTNPDVAVREETVRYVKRAMDAAAELGCGIVTTALLNDGSDYPFEIDYREAFMRTLDAVRECAKYRPDVRLSLEYKASEPRAHCLFNNAGKMAYFCELTGMPNVGVTLDIGHAFQSLEVPADSVAFLGATDRLFYVHINDNYRNWDWDLLPGSVNYWEYIEAVHMLDQVGYRGWVTADVFPGRNDPVLTMTKTFEWFDAINRVAERVCADRLSELRAAGGAFAVLDYVRGLAEGGGGA